MKKKIIRTRFAPSPTGYLHIGGLRTALYSYALAKHSGGKFYLRIDDTDKKREVAGAREKIFEILKLFRISWDEKPVVQSERVKTGVYERAAMSLIRSGHAFYCNCPPRNVKESGVPKVLRDPCRNKNLSSGAIKLMVPEGKEIEFYDFVMDRKVSWNSSEVADTILLKSDGFPTYHLAVVVDDHEMGITHVIRGVEWLSSTPIHLLVYDYLGIEAPLIGHISSILDPSGGKLSKRKGNVAVEQFLEEGYLPEAIINFVVLLGWSPKDNRELFTLEEFIKAFDIKGLQKSNPIFNKDKLDWFNGYYIRKKSDGELLHLLKPFVTNGFDESLMPRIIPLVKERLTKLSDFENLAGFFFAFRKPAPNLFGKNYKLHLQEALKVISQLEDFNLDSLNEGLMRAVKMNNFRTGDFFMDLRVAVTGSKVTPPINESMVILGKEETVKRLKYALYEI